MSDSQPEPSTMARAPRILLAAGGTGGHILPAVALAEALAELAPQAEVQFCCGNRPSELELYRRLGLDPWVLPVAHNRPGPLERARFLRRMWLAFRLARRRLREWPADVAVGFGSYITVPALLAARMAGARVALQELDTKPGVANRLLAPLARQIATAYELPPRTFPAAKTRWVGNPVRAALLHPPSRAEARAFFRLRPEGLVCFCIGGSQGAAGLNRMLLELAGRMTDPDCPAGQWQLLWSTGHQHYKQVVENLHDMGVDPGEHSINPFVLEMARAYAAADVVVARSGATTLAELTAVGRPAVLVPLPTAKGGHQHTNARRLAQSGAAELIEETDPQAADKLERLLGQWAAQPEMLRKMAEAARTQSRPEAARELARLVLGLLPSAQG